MLAAVAGEGGDDATGRVHAPEPLVADVAEVEVAPGRVELDRVRLVQPRSAGGPAVAGEAGRAGAGESGNGAGLSVHLPHDAILHLDKVHVAGGVEAHLVRLVQPRRRRGAAVARVAGLAVAGDGGDGAGIVDPADAVVAHVADVERAVGAATDAVGVVELCLRGRSAVARESRLAGAGDGPDFGRRRTRGEAEDDAQDEPMAE